MFPHSTCCLRNFDSGNNAGVVFLCSAFGVWREDNVSYSSKHSGTVTYKYNTSVNFAWGTRLCTIFMSIIIIPLNSETQTPSWFSNALQHQKLKRVWTFLSETQTPSWFSNDIQHQTLKRMWTSHPKIVVQHNQALL